MRPASIARGRRHRSRCTTTRIRIIRTVNGVKKELRVTLDDIVQPGDTVIVVERIF